MQAVSQKPVFPSKTFPNHYSIVTGLFAESHGIIGNTMFDPVFDATYHITTAAARDGRWYGGEPIWVRRRFVCVCDDELSLTCARARVCVVLFSSRGVDVHRSPL